MATALRNILALICLLMLAPSLQAQDAAPATAQEWIDRIARIKTPIGEDYGAMYLLTYSEHKLVFQVLHDGWNRFQSNAVKNYLLGLVMDRVQVITHPAPGGVTESEEICSPYLPDILELGICDRDPDVKTVAARYLYGIAFQDFSGREAALKEWRVRNAGDLKEIVHSSLHAFLSRLRKANDTERLRMLKSLADVPFNSGTSTHRDVHGDVINTLQASGLVALRRKAALQTDLIAVLLSLLRPEISPSVREQSLVCLMRFHPDPDALLPHTEEIHSELARLMHDKQSPHWHLAANFLGLLNAPWATALQLEAITQTFPDANFADLIITLCTSKDSQSIPTMVALLASGDLETWQAQMTEHALRNLTRVVALNGGQPGRDVDWRKWWQEHRGELPDEVRARPIPHLLTVAMQTGVREIRREATLHRLADDSKRTYLLISPGILLTHNSLTEKLDVQHHRNSDAQNEYAGLLVVLSDGEVNTNAMREFWQNAAKAFGGRYLIALAQAPKWTRQQAVPWVTGRNRAQVPEAKFTTEEFTAQITEDVSVTYPIEPSRVFLLGSSASGPAVYTCSLQPQTTFRGFAIISSEFRAGQLPPLDAAKGRRYYLLQSREDKSAPYFLAVAAERLLTKAGATVCLKPVTGYNPSALTVASIGPLAEAVRWLENIKSR